MPAELHRLLHDATEIAGADGSFDADEIWTRGRRRRRRRQLGASLSGVAGIALVAIVANGVVQQQTVPLIEPIGEADIATDDGEVATTEDEGDEETIATETPPGGDIEVDGGVDGDVASEPEGATPASAAIADPCASDEVEPDGGSFITVASPVAGQQVTDELELVGCASVFEATVRYRILDEAGQPVAEDFVTATAGAPGIGEYRTTVPVPVSGEMVVEVYWQDPSDGSERALVEVPFTAG